MEKRTASGGAAASRRRFGLACLGVSLGGCLALGLALACLEVGRREEMAELRARFQALALETQEMRRSLAHCENVTAFVAAELKAEKESRVVKSDKDIYEDEDYYDDNYDYDEEVEDDGPPAHHRLTGKNLTAEGGASGRRGRRSVQYSNRYNVRIAKGPKSHPVHSPMAVQARIFIEKDGNNYQEFKQKEDQVNRKPEFGKGGDFLPKAVHYGGETSHYLYMRPHHYKGNSRMYHPSGIFKDWTQAHWVKPDSDFFMDNHTGEVTVGTPGLYYVYAQIYYDDSADTSGFKILRNGSGEFQCTVTTITPPSEKSHPTVKRNTCYTGGLLRLLAGDRLSIREVEGHRVTIHERTKSFFGMFRVASK